MSPQQAGSNERGDPGVEGPSGHDNTEDQSATRTVASGEAVAGAVIGVYHLVQPIGHGGMGEVWLAEQKEPVRRRVAIKLIKAGMDTREVVARFESERQALALMDHPSIAKVFDGGSTPQGRPYFVMEYVTGIPITEYCDKHKMTPRQRLELFTHVCQGVQHAHQKAIIHRDLKPSNILVGEVDGKPMPRIIDFGVAKATSQRLTAETLFTRVGAIVGTPGYMSPEQADSTGVDIDTRTDVYSLGVVLYELLVGALPLDFRNVAFQEVLRRLREEDAPAPSTKLRTLGEQSSITAQNRGTDPAALTRQLRGDIDAITLKALEKDRSRRYSSPSELAGDIGRYLRNEPVVARPASAAYRARKYVRRHRIGVAVAAAIAVLLISFAAAQAFELRRITRERDRATRERDRADRITDFMTGMFKVSDPSAARGNSITAREILDKASRDIETGLAKDSELEAQMMSAMGYVYLNLGLYPRAESLLAKSTEIRRRILGTGNPDTLESIDRLAGVFQLEGRFPEAEKLQRESLQVLRATVGPQDLATATTMMHLGSTLSLEGHFAEAEKLHRETLKIREHALGPEHIETAKVMTNLSSDLRHEGQYAEAEKLDRRSLQIYSRVLGPDDPTTEVAEDALSFDFYRQGQFAAAEKLARQTLETRRRILGLEHPDTLGSMASLALILQSESLYAEAEKLQRDALEIRRRVLGAEHPATALSIGNLAMTLQYEGRMTEAEKLYRQELDIESRVLGPEHPSALVVMSNLAGVLVEEKHYAEGEKLMRESLAIERRLLGPDSPFTANTTYNLAMIAALRGQREEALSLLGEAIDHGLQVKGLQQIATAPDLKTLHGDPRFEALVAHAKARAAAAQKPK